MHCPEVRELLHPYVDGELAPEEARAVAEELLRCETCKAEHDELQAVRTLAREAFLAPVEEVDLSHLYQGVMARIAVEAPAADPAIAGVPVARETVRDLDPSPDLLTRIGQLLADLVRFQNPMMSLATAAALVVLVGSLWWLSGSGATAPDASPLPSVGPSISAAPVPGGPGNGKRRDRATETGFVRDTRFVTVEEVARGRVEIEGGSGPNEPVVVWHVIETDAAAPPGNGL